MSVNGATERFPAQGALMLVAGMGLSVLLAYVLQAVRMPADQAAIIASGSAGLPAAIANWIYKRRRGIRAELAALGHGMIVRPVSIVVAIVAGSLLLIVQTIMFLVGFVVGSALAAVSAPQSAMLVAASPGVIYVGYPLVLVAALFVGARACHYFRTRPYAWLLVAVGVFLVVQIALDSTLLLTAPTLESLAFSAALAAAIYGALALGAWRGLRQHEQFVAAKLLRKLPSDDLRAVTALIGETVDARLRAAAPAAASPQLVPVPAPGMPAPPTPAAPANR